MSIRIALAGNPNCGKTTMFNALTGANQYVGNWPGVTVEKKEGRLKTSKGDEEIIITDLPGIYSLSPYTLEEVVSRDYLLKERPEAVINLVDATNIEKSVSDLPASGAGDPGGHCPEHERSAGEKGRPDRHRTAFRALWMSGGGDLRP